LWKPTETGEIVMDTNVVGGIVAGVDGSDSALRAVRWAADEASRRREQLRLVTVFSWTDAHVVGNPGLGAQYRDILLTQSRKALAAAVTVATERQPEVEITHELRTGYPIGTLADEARRARLMVIGDRGTNSIAGLLAGSVAVALATHAACPVVVVRGDEPTEPSALPVVVGVDGSPVSEAAIAFAFQAAAERAAPLSAVHTWWDTFLDPGLTTQLFRDEDQVSEQEVLAQRLAGWSEKYPDVMVERIVARDRPVHLLLEQSGRAQLVVVGSRGHGEFAGMVLGSVSNALIHRAACPVAVVRPDTVSGG
jgi:nucleotide-binding universal stress UspA family protein